LISCPSEQGFGICVPAAVLGGSRVGEQFLVDADAAAKQPVERVGKQNDKQQTTEREQP
jgi:hypothetical protein